jgi:DNA-binding MurR/RpiR family transcriptional regulator
MNDLAERLAASFADLSPQERRAAEFMRDHFADLAVYNATEVAHLSGVSKATVSRLYRRLGFEGAEQVRDHVRALRAGGTPLARDLAPQLADHLEQENTNLRAALADSDITATAAALARAARVVVIGYRNSYPVALHLRQQLAQARDAVTLAPLPGQTIGEEIACLTADDAVVLVGFRRRPRQFERLCETLIEGPATVVLLTDERAGRRVTRVDHSLVCPVESVTAFDSYAAAFSVVSLVAAGVLAENLREGRERIAHIGDTYRELDELEAF